MVRNLNKNISNIILDMNEASRFLHISKSTLYKLTASKQIPFHKPRGKIYFRTADLLEWISKNKVKTIYEIKNESIKYLSRKQK